MANFLSKVLSFGADKDIKAFEKIATQITNLEPQMQAMSDEELRGQTKKFKERYAKGESLDDLLPEAFATVREASVRTTGLRHFDVQLVGGIALHKGTIAEMKTGEGKTLVSTLAGYLNALSGDGVHIVTVNDYLAKRDSEWMGKIYKFLGMTVGLLQNGMRLSLKKPAYEADVTYGTNSEFGFDYLRDNMVTRPDMRVQRGHNFAIVDEVDSILIDEARTPLIISGAGTKSAGTYRDFARAVRGLIPEVDFEMDEAKHTIATTDAGLAKVERALGMEIYGDDAGQLVNHLQQALKAEFMFHRDQQYVVMDGEVKIVDEFTGRIMEGRRYSEGLHQAIEAKEGVEVREENQTLATITLQNYFLMYKKLSGMTGTAMTEDAEFREVYHVPVQVIPPNRPVIRVDHDDLVYRTIDAKFHAVVDDVEERHAKGQPVLVGTVSIDNSERISRLLEKKGITHSVLNAKFHEREAQIVAQAGREGAVTIATNMAGRGTDILLGGNPDVLAEDLLREQGIDPEEATDQQRADAKASADEICQKERQHVLDAGGLCVIGTERHESRRIDNQLRGRSGRQGDPGETEFYLSLEDDLMRRFGGEMMQNIVSRFGLAEDEPLEANVLSRRIENAQKKVEGKNFGIRKYVLQYDNVMNKQRTIIYGERRKVLFGEDIRSDIMNMKDGLVAAIIGPSTMDSKFPEEWNFAEMKRNLNKLIPNFDMRVDYSADELRDMTQESLVDDICAQLDELYTKKEEEIGAEHMREIERVILLRVVDSLWMDHIDAMDQLKSGIGLRAIGQQDPAAEYGKEGFDMFEQMIGAIQEDTVRYCYNVSIDTKAERKSVTGGSMTASKLEYHDEEPQSGEPNQYREKREHKQETVRRESPKIGRNDPCPCGSGKKYKNCCMKKDMAGRE